MLKHFATSACVVGALIIFAASGWWYMHRGELIAEVELERSGGASPENISADKTSAGLVGPFRLTPADNPVRLILTVDAMNLKEGLSFPPCRAHARMLDLSGNVIWDDSYDLAPLTAEQQAELAEQGKKELVAVRRGAFHSIAVPEPGDYSFCCWLEAEAQDWLDEHSEEVALKLAVRRNAPGFPAAATVVGAIILVGGAVGLQMSMEERDGSRGQDAPAETPPGTPA